MGRPLDERAVLRTAQLGLVLAFTSNLVSAAALLVAARALKVEDDCAVVARAPPADARRRDTSAAAPSPAPVAAPQVVAPEVTAEPSLGGVAPLSEAQSVIFLAAPEDSEPVQLQGMRDEVYGRHYLASDEWNPQLFFESVRDRKGAYAGVGTDQAYLFASWARSELVWAIDYDPMVRDLHLVYADFIREAETPEQLLALWRTQGRKRALRLLYELHPDAEERRPLRTAYLRGRIRVLRRLELLQAKLHAAKIPSWLTDQDHYDHVRGLVQTGRVRAMLVDLTGDQGMKGIAQATRELGVPLRVLYLSNAEQYWKYEPEYRDNLAAFEFDEHAIVLRTLSSRKANGDYRYNVHFARDYQHQLRDPAIRQVYQFVDLRRLKGRRDIDFSITGAGPAAAANAGAAGQVTVPAGVAGGVE